MRIIYLLDHLVPNKSLVELESAQAKEIQHNTADTPDISGFREMKSTDSTYRRQTAVSVPLVIFVPIRKAFVIVLICTVPINRPTPVVREGPVLEALFRQLEPLCGSPYEFLGIVGISQACQSC